MTHKKDYDGIVKSTQNIVEHITQELLIIQEHLRTEKGLRMYLQEDSGF